MAGVGGALVAGWISFNGPAVDAQAYWATRAPITYDALPGQDGAYLYSPAFAHVLAPLQMLPWEAFLALILTAMLLTLGWLAGPLMLVPLLPLSWAEILYGNIHIFMAGAIILGFRYPWTWSLILLTKVTPGVGLVWFLARREWRSLAVALGVTVAIAGVSFALDPVGWLGWIQLLERSALAPAYGLGAIVPLWARLPLAVGLVWWGAKHDHRWAVPLAALIALPVLWPGGLALLAGAVALTPRLRSAWTWRGALQ